MSKDHLMDSLKTSFRILMFPWLAHGHIYPYLELAKRLLERKNFYVYLCSTSVNFSSIDSFVKKNSLDGSVERVELRLSPSVELPAHYHTTKNLPSHLVLTLVKAFQTSKSSFSGIISDLKPDLVIFDIFQPWAAKIASSQGIPAVHFASLSASTLAYVHDQYVREPASDAISTAIRLKSHERLVLDNIVQFLRDNVFEEDKDVLFVNLKLSFDIVLVKSSNELEGEYLDYFSDEYGEKIVPIGPLVTYDPDEDSEIIQWLSKKEKHSTVYMSFGSECFLSKDQIGEIAKGLELCGVNFIWIIRFPIEEKRTSTEEALPRGFLERVKGRGKVLHGWAPQAKILSHESIGGFVSHCGWSSILESVYFEVPVIGMPNKIDQPINARMIAEAGACLEVSTDENGVYKGDEIANVIKNVVIEESGEAIRLQARELSRKMRMEEEGALDGAAEHLWQICSRNKVQELGC